MIVQPLTFDGGTATPVTSNTNRTTLFEKFSFSHVGMRNTKSPFLLPKSFNKWEQPGNEIRLVLTHQTGKETGSFVSFRNFIKHRKFGDRFHETAHHSPLALGSGSPMRLVSNVVQKLQVFDAKNVRYSLRSAASKLYLYNSSGWENERNLFRFISGECSESTVTTTGSDPWSNPVRTVRITAGVLAIIPATGILGIHKYYTGSWGWGLLYNTALLTPYVMLMPLGMIFMPSVLWICAVIEGARCLSMTDEAFAAKYPKAAFRW